MAPNAGFFWSWLTMEQEALLLQKQSGLKVLAVPGKLTGCSQEGQDHTSRKV